MSCLYGQKPHLFTGRVVMIAMQKGVDISFGPEGVGSVLGYG